MSAKLPNLSTSDAASPLLQDSSLSLDCRVWLRACEIKVQETQTRRKVSVYWDPTFMLTYDPGNMQARHSPLNMSSDGNSAFLSPGHREHTFLLFLAAFPVFERYRSVSVAFEDAEASLAHLLSRSSQHPQLFHFLLPVGDSI